jgi:seryl-tRNA synthetase
MLDIKFIRENKDLVAAGAKKKHIEIDLDRLLALDDERREITTRVETKRAEQNARSQEISAGGEGREAAIEAMRTLKEDLQQDEEKLKTVLDEWRTLMLQVPNVPDISVPEGESDADNVEVKTWGKPPTFEFEPKDHIALMQQHDMVDFDRGTKVAGFRGYFLKNDGAKLAFAIWQSAVDFFLAEGFIFMMAPSLIRREPFLGTGYLPQSEEDLYKTQDGTYLSGTAEVPIMGYHMDEMIDRSALPIKFLAFSPCFRREAGSHGKDTKGLMRVHEFFKLEQVVLCEGKHDESVRLHEWVNENTERFIEKLGLPYHTVINCGGDLGLGQVKKYDIELWVPSEKQYREISSASYFHDFQSRRLNIRYRDEDNKPRFVHSLNSTAIPTPRILISLIENNQQADGSIKIPEALQAYMGKEVIGG